MEVQAIHRLATGRGIDGRDPSDKKGCPRQVADEPVAELGQIRGVEEGANSGPWRQHVAVERDDDHEEDVLGGRRAIANCDVQALAALHLVPAEVVQQNAADREKPDAEGDHRRPEEDRDQRDEEFRVEADEHDDREAPKRRTQAEDLLVHVAEGACVSLEPRVLAAQPDPLIGRA